MGRHREVSAVRAAEPRSNRGLPGWGLLTAATAAAALAMVNVPPWVNATLCTSVVVVFLVLWQLSAKLPPEPMNDTSTAPAAEGNATDGAAAVPTETQAAQAHEHYAADPDASRWTRTFGPPETGQLPILRYVERAPHRADGDQSNPETRRQWSHSRR